MQTLKVRFPKRKRIALIAHDNRKRIMMEWANQNRELLTRHELFTTGTTGRVLEKELGLPVTPMMSGPLGGDQQIGAMIATNEIDCLFFFWDPLSPMPHDPDVKALLRLAVVWNIPMACNRASADMLLSSPHMDTEYERDVLDYPRYIADRIDREMAEESP